jgi:dipeptidyl-peptidase-3
MKKLSVLALASVIMVSCNNAETAPEGEENAATEVVQNTEKEGEFEWMTEKFADIQILRYQIEGWEKLSLDQKKLAYYLTQAGLAGRDITWDQFYRHNLTIRKALENIVKNYDGDKESENWKNFMEYTKRVWFSNGIHHHYSNVKLKPSFDVAYLDELLSATNTALEGEAKAVIFNDKDAKKVSKDSNSDLVLSSAVNFYDPDITEEEAINFYKAQIKKDDPRPISYGLNSKLVRKEDGSIEEVRWSIDGMYGSAIAEICKVVGVSPRCSRE